MTDNRSERREDLTPEWSPQPVYGLPDGVTADWPTEDDLGVEDDQPVESTRHRHQADWLYRLLERRYAHRADVLVAADLGVFFRPEEPPVVPDVMVVFGVEPRLDWAAYLVWKEKKGPNVVVDLLSTSSADKDRERNYQIYEQRLWVPELIWFDPLKRGDLRGFRLSGGRYEEIVPNRHGRLWSEELGLYWGVHDGWLRLYAPEEEPVLTGDELVIQERAAREAAEAELARLREELARLKAGESGNSPV